jgi:hypothetical protein
MLKLKSLLSVAAVATILFSTSAFAFVGTKKKQATFKVRIENIAASELESADGAKYPFVLSPGLFIVNHKKQYFFDEGKKASMALELLAEDGNPELLYKKLLTKVGGIYMGVFNTPVGADKPGPLLPGGSYEFSFSAEEGMKLNLIAMFGQSNDLFYSPRVALDLFDENGNPLSGDITDRLLLWDAGTEVNQAPGVGDEQAPRQKMANTGRAENGVVGLVKDGFSYPETKNVLRVTITSGDSASITQVSSPQFQVKSGN